MNNGLFEGIIIVSDLDGTFLDNNSAMVLRNINKLEYFKENGGLFTFATGRALSALLCAIPDIDKVCNFPAILCNGSYIYDFEKKCNIGEVFLQKQKAYTLIKEVIEKFPDVGCRIAVGDYHVCPSVNDELIKEKQRYSSLVFEDATLDESYNLCWSKCVFVGQEKLLKQIEQFIMQRENADFEFCFSNNHLFEMLAKGATKKDRLKELKALSNNENAKIFAIGDQENDRGMLCAADFRACPDNAIPTIKQIPNIIKVCANNDGAICDLIEDIENNINIYKA